MGRVWLMCRKVTLDSHHSIVLRDRLSDRTISARVCAPRRALPNAGYWSRGGLASSRVAWTRLEDATFGVRFVHLAGLCSNLDPEVLTNREHSTGRIRA